MFIKTSNGYLLNLNEVEMIYIEAPDEGNPYYTVSAQTKKGHEVKLYKDKEQQYCEQYREALAKEICVDMEKALAR